MTYGINNKSISKKIIFAFILFSCIILSCREDDTIIKECPEIPEPSEQKAYFPYNSGDRIILSDSLGNKDTLDLVSYSDYILTTVEDEACTKKESFNIRFEMNYDSTRSCDILFHASSELYFIETENCELEGSYSLPFVEQETRYIANYEFDGINYAEVYEMSLGDAQSEIEKIVAAKDIGFLFFTINGITRKVI